MSRLSDRDPAFPDRLKRIMLDKKLNQSDLSRRMWGTTLEGEREVAKNRQVIGRYLNGKSYPSFDTRIALSEALGISYAELFPSDDPSTLPGSGIVMTQVNKSNVRVDLSIICPNDVAEKILKLARDYGGTT